MRKTYLWLLALLGTVTANAQDSLWTLQKSIQYAVANNLDIRQSVLNERLSRLQLQQSRFSLIPSASASTNVGRSYGRSIDPTTNQFSTAGYTFYGLNGNVDVLLFGWFQKQNTIAQDKFLVKAAGADLDQLKNDISLNVATGFLRILLAREQTNIAANQVKYSLKQKEQTEYFVKAGRSPELDLAQMEAQVATDSSNYITATVTYQQAILDMKAIMNFDMAEPFFPVAPDVSKISLQEMAGLTPESVYASAKDNFGSIKSNQLRVEAAKKTFAAARGNLYPQLALSGQFGTNYASTLKELTDIQLTGYRPSGAIVYGVDGAPMAVQEPIFSTNTRTTPFWTQLDNNFRQTFALSLSVPLFNNLSSRTAVNRSKVDVMSKQIGLEQSKVKLKQDVYKAYYDASAAIQKYYATSRADESSERAYNYAQKRYELGLMNALELLTTQNNAFKAKAEALSAKYDLLFKLKVIDYYLGKEIKL
jgi:outer membrane protein